MADVKGKMPFFVSKTNPVTITGLTPDTSYDFQLVVYDNNENSTVWEDLITFKTLPATPILNNFQLQLIKPISEFAKGTFKVITTDSIQKAILNLDINNNKTYDFTLNSKIESISYDKQTYPYYCLVYIADTNISTSNRYKLCISQHELKFIQYQSESNYNVKLTYDDSEMFYVIESDTIDGLLTQVPTTQLSSLDVYLNHETSYLLSQNQYRFDYFSSNYDTDFFVNSSDVSTRTYYNYCSIDENGDGTIYIYNLLPETAYEITLTVYDSYNQFAKAGPVTIVTKNIPPLITNIIEQSIKQHEITFYIECETNVGIKTYTYSYGIESVTTPSNPYTIANLQTFTDYTFNITVTDINGQTDSMSKTVKTSGTGPQISDLSITNITTSTATATVIATSQDAIDKYVWSCNNKVSQTDVNTIEIEDLNSYTNYTLNVVVYDINENYDTRNVDFTTQSNGIDILTCDINNIGYTSFDVLLTTEQNIPIKNIEVKLTNVNNEEDIQTFSGFDDLNFTIENVYPNKTYSMKITITDIDNVSTVYNYPTNIVMKTANINLSSIDISDITHDSFVAQVNYTSDIELTGINLTVNDMNDEEVYNETNPSSDNIFNITDLQPRLTGEEYYQVTGNEYSGIAGNVGIDIFDIQGSYQQYTTNGYQLFDASKLPTTSTGGATVTNNGDGSFTISGSGELTETFNLAYIYTIEEAMKLLYVGNLSLKEKRRNTTPYVIFGLCNNNGVPYKYLTNQGSSSQIQTIQLLQDDIDKLSIGDYTLRIFMYGVNGSTITPTTLKPMVYQDGDGTWEPFTGGQPSPSPEYPQEPEFVEIENFYSSGINLLNSASFTNDYYLDSSGNQIDNDVWKISDFQELMKNNGNIYLYNVIGNIPSICFYDSLKNFIYGQSYSNQNTFSVQIPSNAKYIRYSILKDYTNSVISENYSNQTLSTPVTLRALPDDIYDTWINGQTTRNVGSVTFDGSSDENWQASSNNVFFVAVNNGTTNFNVNAINLLCDKLEIINTNIATPAILDNQIKYGNASGGLNNIYLKIPNINSISDLQTWLQSNPITVWYQLATPITQSLSIPTLESFYPFTNAWCDSIVQPQITWNILLGTGQIYSVIGTLQINNFPTENKTLSTKVLTLSNPIYIYFDTDGGTEIETLQKYQNDIINLNDYIPTKTGYDFNGWYIGDTKYEGNYTVGNTDVTFVAQWQIQTFTVTFEYYGDGATYDNKNIQTTTQQVNYGDSALAPTLPENPLTYNFQEWDNDFSSITQNLTVTAQYTGIEYYISFQSEFGTINGLNEDGVLIYNYGEPINILPTISGISQDFEGWSTVNGNPDNIVTTSTIWTFTDVDMLYAIFETYKLTYNYNNGVGYNYTQLLNANGFAYYNTSGNSATIQVTDNNSIVLNTVSGTTHIIRSLFSISSPTYGMVCYGDVNNNATISINLTNDITSQEYDVNSLISNNVSQNIYIEYVITVPSSPGIYNITNLMVLGLYEESPSYQYKTVGEPVGTLPITWSASKNNIGTWYDNQQGTNEILSSTIFNDATTIYALYKEREKISVLLDGGSFNSKLSTLISQATSIIFTNNKIPDDKISSATVVSISNSPYISYLYLDGNTVYIAPEEEGVTIYANIDCSMMFQYTTTISTIIFDNFNTSHTESMYRMFGYSGITSIDLSKLDTSNVNAMNKMFYSCYKLASADLSMLNTSNVTTMENCFYENRVLTSVNLSNIDCSKLNDITMMFYRCVQLSSITFFTNNTTSLQYFGGTFAYCSSLTNIDLSHLDTTNIASFSYAFRECTNLTSNIIIRNQNNPEYSDMLHNCSTNSNAQFVVNYIDDNTKTLAEQMVATKSSSSNVVLGTLQS